MDSDVNSGADHLVELIVREEPPSIVDDVPISEEIAPLLTQIEKPKINIFTISYPRRKPMEQVNKIHDSDVSSLSQSIIWIWSGSRYSGLLCASLSSIFYFGMEVLMGVFSAQSIPIIEMAFTRCVIITILSYLWLRRSEQPIFGQPHVRKLLVSRALTGLLSMMSFIYSIRRLHISQAIVLSFTTPILASVAARFILHEKLKFSDFGGLTKAGKGSTTPSLGSHHAYAVLLGFVASIAGAVSYCLIRASAKASDQPVGFELSARYEEFCSGISLSGNLGESKPLERLGLDPNRVLLSVTVFSFGLLAGPVTGICTVIFEDLVLPSLYSFLLMLVLGLLAFLAEVCWARGLQLEKTSKVCNLRFMEASFVQLWHIGILGVVPFGRIVGTLLIFLSLCWTFYVGPDREME
uniref:EamA domain-containing protein n=1 Tax=Cucumis melo TaxID=3656 RepID=A0A9I9D8N2_CUCME